MITRMMASLWASKVLHTTLDIIANAGSVTFGFQRGKQRFDGIPLFLNEDVGNGENQWLAPLCIDDGLRLFGRLQKD